MTPLPASTDIFGKLSAVFTLSRRRRSVDLISN